MAQVASERGRCLCRRWELESLPISKVLMCSDSYATTSAVTLKRCRKTLMIWRDTGRATAAAMELRQFQTTMPHNYDHKSWTGLRG